jgi:hypothetical protein
MDNEEALRLLDREMDALRTESYADLARRIDTESREYELSGSGGARYQVEIQFLWDDRTGGNVLVVGSIDDGGWRAFVPLTRSFIKSADGSFVGE